MPPENISALEKPCLISLAFSLAFYIPGYPYFSLFSLIMDTNFSSLKQRKTLENTAFRNIFKGFLLAETVGFEPIMYDV